MRPKLRCILTIKSSTSLFHFCCRLLTHLKITEPFQVSTKVKYDIIRTSYRYLSFAHSNKLASVLARMPTSAILLPLQLVAFEFHLQAYRTTRSEGTKTMVYDTSRHRNSNDDLVGDYRPGSIQRVKLHNFLTHSNVEFKPGPR
jgi:hypothetical protein